MNEEIDYKNFISFFLKVARLYLKWFVAMLFVGGYAAAHTVLQPYVLKVLLDSASNPAPGQFANDT